jgi:hypothetical protein
MDMLRIGLLFLAATTLDIWLAVCICGFAKLDEVQLSRLTVAGWLLLIVTVIVTVMVSFAIGRRLYDVLTYESGRVVWRDPLCSGVALFALLFFALGKTCLTRLGVQIVRRDPEPLPKSK